jgi:hypothetical protein
MLKPQVLKGPFLLTWLTVAIASAPMAASAAQGSPERESSGSWLVAQSTQQQAADFSDEQIAAFVEARQSVIEIAEQWEDRLQNADSQEELNSLQQASQEEMVEAVREEGITVNEYNMIVDATQTDPELRERVNDMMTQ